MKFMKDVVKTVLEHPIATIIVLGSLTRGIATIVAAAKGNSVDPVVKLDMKVPEKVNVET